MKKTNKASKPNLVCNILTVAHKKAFSLIEILVSLIIISLVVSAFVPVITKKLKASEVTIGNFTPPVTSNCDEFSTGDYKCLMCSNTSCTLCQSQLSIPYGYYVDPSQSCEPKECSNKFGSNCSDCKTDRCTSCANVAIGQYADPNEGCVAKACSTKFGLGCSTCTKDYCTSCKGGYGFNAITHACTQCNAGYASPGGASSCAKCSSGWVSAAGASTCTECKASEHKVANSTNTACENKWCSLGQYIDGVTCKECPEGTYMMSNSHQSTNCATCPASSHLVPNKTTGATGCVNKYCGVNQYIDGIECKSCTGATYQTSTSHQNTSCSSCPAECSSCTSATKCTACTGVYTLTADGKCTLGCNPQTVTLSGATTKVTRFNMGDDPQCPRSIIEAISGVVFVPVKTSCTDDYCCWYGATAGSNCSDKSGGIYSGCNRTVCKWAAADKICKSIGTGWKLPDTSASMASWYPTNSKAASGLMLCDNNSGGTKFSMCTPTANCPGATNGNCSMNHVWAYSNSGSTAQDSGLRSGSWKTDTNDKSQAFSVRCVKE